MCIRDRKITLATIRSIMKKDYSLSFGKITKVPNKANSLRNLYKRQQFGKKMLDLLGAGMRILNVDETWIG